MEPARQSSPTEDPHAEERRFEEEGEQSLHRQRGTEDVADEAGVFAPGHAELEFLDETGGHAHDEVDEEELAEELRRPQVDLVARAVVDGLEDRDEHAEPEGERNHPEVVDRGDAELPTADEHRIQFHGLLQSCRRGNLSTTRRILRPVEVGWTTSHSATHHVPETASASRQIPRHQVEPTAHRGRPHMEFDIA
ncbi:Uncharacterised protein [Mycobacteroides abscessus subsp. abscessus]|nr:Uncharacterised protein [Mycobacteroides abscessus subsp. abscessus]